MSSLSKAGKTSTNASNPLFGDLGQHVFGMYIHIQSHTHIYIYIENMY